ncbi:MAG: hypothetical protein HY296_06650 [Thaumarchaeota archaeon]|nr:hypothetical protein [Nitrososphaerota archaeon]
MTKNTHPDIAEDVLQEGCYYLAQLGLPDEKIAAHFETDPATVSRLITAYKAKLESGEVAAGDFDKVFWEDVRKEADGDMKLTFVSDKGFHHSWKSELERLDGRALMSIYEASKDFVNMDQNQKFLDFPPPKGYDPLALDREVKKAVVVIEQLLGEKWKAERKRIGENPPP